MCQKLHTNLIFTVSKLHTAQTSVDSYPWQTNLVLKIIILIIVFWYCAWERKVNRKDLNISWDGTLHKAFLIAKNTVWWTGSSDCPWHCNSVERGASVKKYISYAVCKTICVCAYVCLHLCVSGNKPNEFEHISLGDQVSILL